MVPVVSTDYPFLAVKWQPVSIFGFLALQCEGMTGNTAGLSIRGSNRTTRTLLLSVPGSLLSNVVSFKSPSWGPLNRLSCAFSLAINGHSGYPGPLFGADENCRLGLAGTRYTGTTCSRFRQYFQVWFFIPPRLHSLSDFLLSTTFGSTPL